MTAPPPTQASSADQYRFSGHALGASLHFHQLDRATGLNHLVPTLAASVLPPTGGLSKSSAANYCFKVDQPRPRTLFSLGQASSTAAGRSLGAKYETEVEVDIQSVEVVEKLRIGLVRLHMLSTFTPGGKEPVVTTTGNRIEGVWLGNKVEARITMDDEPLCYCGTRDQLAALYRGKDTSYRKKYAWRYATPAGAPDVAAHGVHVKCSLVRSIKLVGPEAEKQGMSVDGYTIIWNGFGKIVLGEVHVKGNDRQLSMVRLAMGSDAGGSGTTGGGQSNGQTG